MKKRKLVLLEDKLNRAQRIAKEYGLKDADNLISELSKAGLEKKYPNFIVCQEICESLINACCHPFLDKLLTDEQADEKLKLSLDLFYEQTNEKWTLYPIVEGLLDYPRQKYSKEALEKGRRILIRKITDDNLDIRELGISFKTAFPDFYGTEYTILTCKSEYRDWLSLNPEEIEKDEPPLLVYSLVKGFLGLDRWKKLDVLSYGLAVTLLLISYHYFFAGVINNFVSENFFKLPPFSFFLVFPALLGPVIFTFLPLMGVVIFVLAGIVDIFRLVKNRRK
jgi:hypothetical protein